MRISDVSPWFISGLYLFGLALMATAAIDLFTTVWPFRLDQAAWRYGFLGLAAGYLQTPALGIILIALAAHADERPVVMSVVGTVCLAVSVVLLLAMAIFAVDVLQVRATRPPEAQGSVLTGAFFQEVKYGMAAAVFALLGIGARRSAMALDKRMS